MERKEIITSGQAVLGIELGSTRIKAVLIGPDHAPIASGDHGWENRYENGVWTYHMDDVWAGLQDAYASLCADVAEKYGVKLTKVAAMGFSAMMHGYLPLDGNGELLAPFRTWRNTMTAQAAEELTGRFGFNIPQRWSIAHLYQAILNGEEHVKDIVYLTTLAGYVHYKLTGVKALGVGEASGMFPIDSDSCDYDQAMVDSFDALVADRGYPWKLRDILPKVLPAGADAGSLTPRGPSCWTLPGPWSPDARWPLPRGTRAPAWRPPTRWPPAPATCPPAPRCFAIDRAGEGPQQGLSGDRHGDHPHRQAGGYGPLQQLHQRDQRLGQGFQGLPGGPGPEARYECGVHRHV